MQTKLDKFGRVLNPKKIRQDLGLRPGEMLGLEQSNGKIIITPNSDDECLTVKDGVLIFTGKAEGDLSDAIKNDREARIRKLSAGLP